MDNVFFKLCFFFCNFLLQSTVLSQVEAVCLSQAITHWQNAKSLALDQLLTAARASASHLDQLSEQTNTLTDLAAQHQQTSEELLVNLEDAKEYQRLLFERQREMRNLQTHALEEARELGLHLDRVSSTVDTVLKLDFQSWRQRQGLSTWWQMALYALSGLVIWIVTGSGPKLQQARWPAVGCLGIGSFSGVDGCG
jgi:hypothetical protein